MNFSEKLREREREMNLFSDEPTFFACYLLQDAVALKVCERLILRAGPEEELTDRMLYIGTYRGTK